MVPITKTWEGLGFTGIPETRPAIERDTDWFARQPENVWRQMVGLAKYTAWKVGKSNLQDLVGQSQACAWCPFRLVYSTQRKTSGVCPSFPG